MDVDQLFIKLKFVKILEFIEFNRFFDLFKVSLVIICFGLKFLSIFCVLK